MQETSHIDSILLIGAGNLGEAMLDGMIKKGVEVRALVRTAEKAQKLEEFYPSLRVEISKKVINIDGESVVVAVKPSNFGSIEFEGTAENFISVMAKIRIEELKNNAISKNYIRAMPNIAAKYEKSITAVTGSVSAKEGSLRLFESIGKSVWVDTEDELNIATALAGSAPAFLALAAEALTDGAVMSGMKRAAATEMTKGLFDGFSVLLENSHPAKIKEDVMSPKGTTAAGLMTLESAGVRAAFMRAIESAYRQC